MNRDLFEQIRSRMKHLPGENQVSPFHQAVKMVSEIPEEDIKNPDYKYLDPAAGSGTFAVALFDRLVEYHSEEVILNEMIHVAEVSAMKIRILKQVGFKNVYHVDSLDHNFNMEFNNIIFNPPYNPPRISKDGKKQPMSNIPLWAKFVNHFGDMLAENGHLISIHPAGWRQGKTGNGKDITNLNKLLTSELDLLKLTTSDLDTGKALFGCMTTCDWYVARKSNEKPLTKVTDLNGNEAEKDVTNCKFIPNLLDGWDDAIALLAKEGEETVQMLEKPNAYHTYTNKNVVKEAQKTDEHIYPVVATVNSEGVKFRWSSVNDLGHYGVPKVFVTDGNSKAHTDLNGDWAMCEFCRAIVDEPEVLPKIEKALNHPKFLKAMKNLGAGTMTYNLKVIPALRKDFWKDYQY